jgi:hypothetical protein
MQIKRKGQEVTSEMEWGCSWDTVQIIIFGDLLSAVG